MRIFLPIALVVLAAWLMLFHEEPGSTCEVWTYRTRPGEEASRVYVCAQQEYLTEGRIYHLYVDGLEIPNPHATGAEDAKIPVLAHLPITQAAFEASVLERVRDDAPVPPFRAGYDRWKKAFLNNEARAFDVPIAECIEQMAAGLR